MNRDRVKEVLKTQKERLATAQNDAIKRRQSQLFPGETMPPTWLITQTDPQYRAVVQDINRGAAERIKELYTPELVKAREAITVDVPNEAVNDLNMLKAGRPTKELLSIYAEKWRDNPSVIRSIADIGAQNNIYGVGADTPGMQAYNNYIALQEEAAQIQRGAIKGDVPGTEFAIAMLELERGDE